MRAFDRDPIREGHYGQRPCAPRSKAGHMAASTTAATCCECLTTRSRPHMAPMAELGQRGATFQEVVRADILARCRFRFGPGAVFGGREPNIDFPCRTKPRGRETVELPVFPVLMCVQWANRRELRSYDPRLTLSEAVPLRPLPGYPSPEYSAKQIEPNFADRLLKSIKDSPLRSSAPGGSCWLFESTIGSNARPPAERSQRPASGLKRCWKCTR